MPEEILTSQPTTSTARDAAPSITILRRVEWPDTDAAGHQHHSVVIRWVEAAEAVLLARRGLLSLFGRLPRVRYEVDYRKRLWLGQTVAISLTVAELGRSSIRYDFEIVTSEGDTAAVGNLIAVLSEPGTDASQPWPDGMRSQLTSGGRQDPETYAEEFSWRQEVT